MSMFGAVDLSSLAPATKPAGSAGGTSPSSPAEASSSCALPSGHSQSATCSKP